MHPIAFRAVAQLNNTAVLVTAHSSNAHKCDILNAATGEFIASIEPGESLFDGSICWDVKLYYGAVIEHETFESAIDEVKVCAAFPTEAGNRNYSRAVYKETSY